MLIAISVLLLCSCKQGALPLHSAYKYNQVQTRDCRVEDVSLANSKSCLQTDAPSYIGLVDKLTVDSVLYPVAHDVEPVPCLD